MYEKDRYKTSMDYKIVYNNEMIDQKILIEIKNTCSKD